VALAWLLAGLGVVGLSVDDCECGVASARGLREEPTVARLAATIDCQVRDQSRGAYLRRLPDHYRPEQIEAHAEAALDACRLAPWPQGLHWWRAVPLLVATVDQQSRWVADAVSRWNRDADGQRIRPGHRPWRAADRRLDYGLFQLRWNTLHAWAPGTTLSDLRDPATNLRLGARWLAKRASVCWDLLGSIRKPTCKTRQERDSVTCRCFATLRALGCPGYAGSTRSLVRTFAPEFWRCFDAAQGEET